MASYWDEVVLGRVRHQKKAANNYCGICQLSFEKYYGLQVHMHKSPRHDNYCNICNRVFKDRDGLQSHVESRPGHELSCNVCLWVFPNEPARRNHITNLCKEDDYRAVKKPSRCESCGQVFGSILEREMHWKTTSLHKHCLISGCDFDGPDEAALARHVDEAHFRCGGCKKVFLSNKSLRHHCHTCPFSEVCAGCGNKWFGFTMPGEPKKEHDCWWKRKNTPEAIAHRQRIGYVAPGQGAIGQGEAGEGVSGPSNSMSCWCCKAPMRSWSGLVAHLESGRCPRFTDPTMLLRCLGQWGYAFVYMELDIHTKLRFGYANASALWPLMNSGEMKFFLCRGIECRRHFSHLSELIAHCEGDQTCERDLDPLNLEGLEKEIRHMCASIQRSGTA